jgi:N-methylhydantoinase B
MTFSYASDRQKVSPWEIHGGHPGAKAELFMMRKGSDEWLTITKALNTVLPSKVSNVPIAPGDRIKISSPAGGGWGQPDERDPYMVKEDLLDGFITPEQAQPAYGLKRQSTPVAFPSSDPKQRPL